MADALDRVATRDLMDAALDSTPMHKPVVDIQPGEYPDDHKQRCLDLMAYRSHNKLNIWTGEPLSDHDNMVQECDDED